MFKLLVATVIVAFATPAAAQIQPDVQFALHNGSVMAILSDGAGGVRIEYAEPKPSLLQIGVRQGTLLFDGHWQRDALFGRARVYNLVCGPVPYEVQGGVVDRGGTLVLHGPQMRVNQFCQPYYLAWTDNSVLMFTPLPARGNAATPDVVPLPSPKVQTMPPPPTRSDASGWLR
jgi:hypothetical protein